MATRSGEPIRTVQGMETRPGDAGREGFKPIWEWKQEDQSLLLLVYLPGFSKEQLNVSTHGTNTLQIQGWRLAGGGRRQSFQEEFEVPEECSMAGIRAQLKGGVLTITIPKRKKTAAAAAVPPPPDTTPKRHQEVGGGDKFRASPKRKDASPTTAALPPQDTMPKRHQDGKFRATPEREDASTLKPKQTDISKSSEAAKKGPEKQAADLKWEMESTGQARKVAGERKERVEGRGQTAESKLAEKKDQQSSITKPRKEEEVVPKREDSITKPTPEENAVLRKEKEEGEEEKAREARERRGGDGGGFSLEKYGEAVKGLAKGELKEETQLMVNMGVAVLVIVALGAYISFTTFGKSKN